MPKETAVRDGRAANVRAVTWWMRGRLLAPAAGGVASDERLRGLAFWGGGRGAGACGG